MEITVIDFRFAKSIYVIGVVSATQFMHSNDKWRYSFLPISHFKIIYVTLERFSTRRIHEKATKW